MLEIKNLSKEYGNNLALDNFSIKMEEGIYGILGANGAGKSTLMNLITDNVTRTSGQILYGGRDILEMGEEFRKIVGYMPQQQGFYEQFSAKAFIVYMAALKGIRGRKARQEADRLLKLVNLDDVAHKKIGSFSGGMKQRVLLAQALIGEPKILILDEPTAGLDPKERIRIRNFISELSKDKIIIYATHVVSDIECIADHVLLIKKGRMIGMGTPSELIDGISGKVAEVTCTKEELNKLQQKHRFANVSQKREGLTLRVVGDDLPAEYKRVENDINLEDVYLYYFEYLDEKKAAENETASDETEDKHHEMTGDNSSDVSKENI